MSKEKNEKLSEAPPNDGSGAVVAKPVRKRQPKRKPPQPLPPWKVLLHNDDKNEVPFVIKTIMELTPLNEQDARHQQLPGAIGKAHGPWSKCAVVTQGLMDSSVPPARRLEDQPGEG